MSIFTSIGNFIGGLLSGTNASRLTSSVYNAVTPTRPSTGGMNFPVSPGTSIAPTYRPQQVTGRSTGGTTYYAGSGVQNTAGQMDTGNDMSQNLGSIPRYTPVPRGGAYSTTGGTSAGSQYITPSPYIFDKTSGREYTKPANVGNLDISGMTQEQADQAIEQKKSVQIGQTSALTSSVYTPEMMSNTSKVLKDFGLSLDNISKDTWSSQETKQSKIDNLLKVTADNISQNFDTPDQLVTAIQDNPELQQQVDRYVKAGGKAQDILDKFQVKNTPQTNMDTADYLASVQDKETVANIVPENKLIQDRIAEEAKIPEDLKKQYFGDNGYITQRIKLDQEKVDMLKEQIAKAEATEREQLNYHIQKNNAEAEIARNTIEQNKNNAKNYITGMLAKLGALQTTSAAVTGIATLDQKYEQQKSELDTKLKFANQALEIDSRNKINELESKLADKVQSIKEDLSKDTIDILKEISKEEKASKKEIFNLTLKMNDRIKKNIDSYKNNATMIAETYSKNFLDLASGGMDVGKIASTLSAPLSKADQSVSMSARLKDPSAISLFKSLPADFKYQWINYTNQQSKDRYFTLPDLQQAYEAYQVDKTVPKKKTTTNREI